MKKFLAILSLIMLMVSFTGCHQHSYSSEWSNDLNEHWHAATCHDDQKQDVASHVWLESGEIDADGNIVYKCSTCGFIHQHVYDAEKWAYNGREHWHPITCGHEQAPRFAVEHEFDDETGLCAVCGCDQAKVDGYEVAFAYYVVDEDGKPAVDSEGNYSQIGVTYTSVNTAGSVQIDTTKGAILYEGDIISFTVEKSVFCYYTDAADKPMVETISSAEDGKKIIETIEPDENGIYTVKIQGDTIISVANVATSPRTITGKGTKEEPFILNSEVDWLYFAMYVNDKSYYGIDYNIAYWELNADLDFEGEVIYVIGDGFSSPNSVFCGNFNGNGHTISNFVLENSISSAVGSGYSNYLGLFGVVTGYVGVDSVIANLTVENVTVNATAGNDDIVSAGCILGYGVGANIRNCKVVNGNINVIADDTYMSFAGGLVGYLQSGMTEDGMLFFSSVGYSVAENVTIKGTGMLYNAGGIVGRVVSYSEQVTSFIINSYSSGDIADAVRSGGIVGEMQRFGTIQNCYSTASVSAYSTFKSDIEQKFEGTTYDDRYSYAGGVVGYVENDAVVEGCFFDGGVYATALAGADFAKKANIVAGCSEERFSDYYANKAVLNNQPDGIKVTNDYLKNTFKWDEADWVFGEGYPTINQSEVTRSFNITVNIDGADEHVCTVDSQYLPLSYWYLLDGNKANGFQTFSRYYSDGTKRTYGYYFDSALTKPIPVGYVPMNDITLYAGYKNTSTIAGEYYISNNRMQAILTIDTNGTYTYEEGAILLKGEYDFNGEIVTFDRAVFSRLASTATELQKSSYYTFWAILQPNGNLHIFDCDELYIVSSDDEAQNPTFTSMARFYTTENPLLVISADNLSFTGGYYYIDGNVKHVFEFNNDYTGVYRKYSGESVDTDTFTFSAQDEEKLVLALDENGMSFNVFIQGGVPVSIKDNSDSEFSLSQIDGFAGTWEKSATTHKLYTFDGMGNWSYEHYVYLSDDNLVNANKQVVSRDNGIYTIDNGVLKLTRNDNGSYISVTATIENGVVYVCENGQPVQVEFTNANGYKGIWYTANNKIIRYTLTLEGLNTNGVGNAMLDGFEIQPLKLRYTAVSSDTLYLYVDNIVYAVLKYSAKTGLFDGMFYNSDTGTTSTPHTLYLYDDFTGSWVSDVDELASIKFNGLGGYNTSDKTGDFLAVKGIVTIGNDNVEYTVDRQTEKASFTYKGVKYVLSYNEYANIVSVSYNGNEGTIAKADSFGDIVLKDQTASYKFDGRGNFTEGGKVISNGVSGIYKIQADGNLLMSFANKPDQIIQVIKQEGQVKGFTLNGSSLYVENSFSGVWAVPTEKVSSSTASSIVIGDMAYMPALGQTLEIQGWYNGESVTMYYNGVDTVSFEHAGNKYSIINTLGGLVPALVLKKTVVLTEETVTEKIIVRQDDFFGEWKKLGSKNTLVFDGCGNSAYLSSGNVQEYLGGFAYNSTYKIVDGVVTIYRNGNVYATFVACQSDTQGDVYEQNGKYYQLLIA